eukprot:9665566-Heterocapsa_arctica.AAC.1
MARSALTTTDRIRKKDQDQDQDLKRKVLVLVCCPSPNRVIFTWLLVKVGASQNEPPSRWFKSAPTL